jgi:large subunit ribosomal protein L3
MKFILGKKLTMTQKFKADGQVVPVTVIQAGPCFITQVKNEAKDGYKAIQVGYGEKKKLNKPLSGHLKNNLKARYLKELRVEDKAEYQKGQKISVAIFQKGEKVKVTGLTKGRGFQGVVKRHGFSGAPKSHGTKDQLRHSGSVGAKGVAHTFKGTKMGGRMGGNQVSIKNLEIIDLEPEKNLLYIKGAIPGSRNNLVEIYAPGEMKLEQVTATQGLDGEEKKEAAKTFAKETKA